MSQIIKEIDEWEVLTPTGWQDFDGIKKVTKDSSLTISYRLPDGNTQEIICSKGHQLFVKRHEEEMFCFAELLEPGTDEILYKDGATYCAIESIVESNEEIDLYDLVNVRNGYEYIANDVVNHNCAHVEGIDELWLGLAPTLSVGGSAILISSPSGVGTFFHKMWVGAKKDQNNRKEGENGFMPIELPWTVHPEHDEKWFQTMRASIVAAKGERGVSQELLCAFQSSGDTFLKGDTLDYMQGLMADPSNIQPFEKDEVWIWKAPQPGETYVIGADVARGDGEDYSAFNIACVSTSEIVADFRGKPPPDRFAELLITYGNLYNTALICQELNNVGVAAAIKLKESGYTNLYYEKFMKNMYMSYVTKDVGDELPGFTTNPNTRVEMLAKLENTLRNKNIKVYSKRLFEEFQTFVWKGNKPQAQKGYNDDLVMSLAITCQMYEASATKDQFEDVNMAMALLKGMTRESKTLNSITGQQETKTFGLTDADMGPGPISAAISEVIGSTRSGLNKESELKKKILEERKRRKQIFGEFDWMMDD